MELFPQLFNEKKDHIKMNPTKIVSHTLRRDLLNKESPNTLKSTDYAISATKSHKDPRGLSNSSGFCSIRCIYRGEHKKISLCKLTVPLKRINIIIP